jgi:GDP-L-fucose synthase
MNNHSDPHIINIGSGEEISIKTLAETIAHIVDYKGEIVWDKTQPNGTPHRALDLSKMNALGWKAKTTLEEGLRKVVSKQINLF